MCQEVELQSTSQLLTLAAPLVSAASKIFFEKSQTQLKIISILQNAFSGQLRSKLSVGALWGFILFLTSHERAGAYNVLLLEANLHIVFLFAPKCSRHLWLTKGYEENVDRAEGYVHFAKSHVPFGTKQAPPNFP